MGTALLLGLLQGLVEWLPVSSEGIVSAAHFSLTDRPLEEAVGYALWLHLGTAPAALLIFRKEAKALLGEVFNRSAPPSPLLSYLLISTLVSAAVGLPLLLALNEISGRLGSAAMVMVGLFTLITGLIQLRRRQAGTRGRADLNPRDAIVLGLVQGVATLPGFSRSGTTVSALLARGVSGREALVLSFLMSIPASLGAALYVLYNSGVAISWETAAATLAAFAAGLATIHVLLSLAERVNFAWFALALGLAITASASARLFT